MLFGLPVAEAVSAGQDNRIILAGCLVPEDPPNRSCRNHHDWHDPDEPAWQQELGGILREYGYPDSAE